MKLSPREIDKLMLHNAGQLAQRRLARGLRLNHSEASALISSQILEFVRDGQFSVAQLMDLGRQFLGRKQVLPSVPYLMESVQVEGTFPDGTKLITIHDPISGENGDLNLALHGSFLPVPSLDKFPAVEGCIIPGELIFAPGLITINSGRKGIVLSVKNTGDRPVQVGSHYHFIEVNPHLVYDRSKAYGMRLNMPAGTAVRFEPGEEKPVPLIRIGGKRIIRGGNNIADGLVDDTKITLSMKAVCDGKYGFSEEANVREYVVEEGSSVSYPMTHEKYSSMYGPTTGDKIRLGDTDLLAEVERDFAIYGDECVFGGGKVVRDGMGQASGYHAHECLDTVITNALIIDYTGIYKADIGIKDGNIIAIGKAGNPDSMDGVFKNMIIGLSTEVIAGEGKIVTAGAIDCHVHYICPQQAYEAIASGITTLVGGGTGPSEGTRATTCTPAPFHMKLMLQSTDDMPLNFGFTGKGNSSKEEGLHDIIKAGAMGLKLHEDWGTTPATIDKCLSIADLYGVQVNIHTDTLNESGFVEQTIAAFKDRSIHTYHSEGAGGGHAPDIIKVCGLKNVLPSSTNPTRPYTFNTVDEHLDMLMVAHHLNKNIPEDVAFAESRIRSETIAAEDILHDMGAISIISSDSQAMGRIGEVISRTWQTAHKMKLFRGPLESNPQGNDNSRIKRYIAKYTINPAIVCGISKHVGSVEVGKLADLVLWKPAFFGTKPEMIVKGGTIAWADMGDPNASIPTPEPVVMRPMFGAYAKAGSANSIAFVSKISLDRGITEQFRLKKRVEAVSNVRKLTKLDMKLNDALPMIEVDPETYVVKANGQVAGQSFCRNSFLHTLMFDFSTCSCWTPTTRVSCFVVSIYRFRETQGVRETLWKRSVKWPQSLESCPNLRVLIFDVGIFLTSLKVVYVLSTPMSEVPENPDDETMEAARIRMKWINDDYICRGHILNAMADNLFDIYQSIDTAKELWDDLEAKYMAKDASSRKFLVSDFNNYKMVDSRLVMEQYNELLRVLGQFAQHELKMDEPIAVSCIIDKLPPSWKEFKRTLKHKKEEITLIELGSHLRIEESLRAQENGKERAAGNSSVNMVEEGKKGQSSKVNNGKKRKFGKDGKKFQQEVQDGMLELWKIWTS